MQRNQTLAMLDRIRLCNEHGPMDALLITASGGREITKLRNLIRAGWVKVVPHPELTGPDKKPVEALVITDAGRAALAS